MATNSRQPAQVFMSSVPLALLKEVYNLLCREHPKSLREVAHLPDEQARYLRPHVRRANIESGLRDIAARFPQVEAKVVPNPTGDCHVELVCGTVSLTCSHVDSPDRVIQMANFRRTLAEDCNLSLFNDRPPGEKLYALCLHGGDATSHNLGFAKIVFPIPVSYETSGIKYHPDQIKLSPAMFEKKSGGSQQDDGQEPEIREQPEVG